MAKVRYPWDDAGDLVPNPVVGGPALRQLLAFLQEFSEGRPEDQLLWDRYFSKWGEAPAATPPAFIRSDVAIPKDRELTEGELAEVAGRTCKPSGMNSTNR